MFDGAVIKINNSISVDNDDGIHDDINNDIDIILLTILFDFLTTFSM